MRVVTVSDFRSNVAGYLDGIEEDADDLVITRSGHEPVVVMPKADYDAWVETEYVSQGLNGVRLRESIAQLEAGRTQPWQPVEPEDVPAQASAA